MKRRPSFTTSVVRGLEHIASLASSELEAGPEGSGWAQTLALKRGATDDAHRAMTYLYALCAWAEARERGRADG